MGCVDVRMRSSEDCAGKYTPCRVKTAAVGCFTKADI